MCIMRRPIPALDVFAGPQPLLKRIVRDAFAWDYIHQASQQGTHPTACCLLSVLFHFLVRYIVNHALHGDTIFPVTAGAPRYTPFWPPRDPFIVARRWC